MRERPAVHSDGAIARLALHPLHFINQFDDQLGTFRELVCRPLGVVELRDHTTVLRLKGRSE